LHPLSNYGHRPLPPLTASRLPKRFADLWGSQSPSAAPDLIPTPVAGTPSASKSPHPDRSDPDRAEPGHCRMPGVHRVEHVPTRISSPRGDGRRCLGVPPTGYTAAAKLTRPATTGSSPQRATPIRPLSVTRTSVVGRREVGMLESRLSQRSPDTAPRSPMHCSTRSLPAESS
jgi:hypothetical protein